MTRHEDHARLAVLVEALGADIASVERLLPEAAALAAEAKPRPMHARALGSVLHDYYTGVERALKRIVDVVDGTRPSGTTWHQALLEQAGLEIPGVRPLIVSSALVADLREWLGFRHLFRNVYGSELRWDRLQALAASLPALHAKVRAALHDFVAFLRSLAEEV